MGWEETPLSSAYLIWMREHKIPEASRSHFAIKNTGRLDEWMIQRPEQTMERCLVFSEKLMN